MIDPAFDVGAFVLGAPTSPRGLVRHADLLAAYADGTLEDEREAYLSLFVFGTEMQTHFGQNRNSVAGYAGASWCRWLVLDIDRPDLAEALLDARRLVSFLHGRYSETEGRVPIYFSGSKGFHVLIELTHNPTPSVGFHRTARMLAEAIANRAGVTIDTSIYDIAHIIRLPNTRHPKTGLFKRRIDSEVLFSLDINGIRHHAAHPAGDGIPTVRGISDQLKKDWIEAERTTQLASEARSVAQQNGNTPDVRAPRYFIDLLRFGTEEGNRHQTLFRCAAWLTEQGSPPSLCSALLTEPGRDIGLSPKDVERQIACGIAHARRQRMGIDVEPAEEDRGDAWEPPHLRGICDLAASILEEVAF